MKSQGQRKKVRAYWPAVEVRQSHQTGVRSAGRMPSRVPSFVATVAHGPQRPTPPYRHAGATVLKVSECLRQTAAALDAVVRGGGRFGMMAGPAAAVLVVAFGSLAVAQNTGISIPFFGRTVTLDLQPLFPGERKRTAREQAAGIADEPARPGVDPGADPEPVDPDAPLVPVSPVTEDPRARPDPLDVRSRFDRLREEREARRAELDNDKKQRLAEEARPFAERPYGITAFEDTVRQRERPDFESYGLALDRVWRAPLEAAGLIEEEPLADNPSGLEVFVGASLERGITNSALRTDLDERSDGITIGRTRLDLVSDFDLWSLSGALRTESARFDDESSEDYDDVNAAFGVATEYEDFLLLSANAAFSQGHIARGTSDDLGAVRSGGGRNEIVEFTRTDVAGRFVLGRSDGYFIRPEISFSELDFDQVVGTDIVTGQAYDSNDFDRSEMQISLRAGKNLLRRQAYFGELRYVEADFDNQVDRFGFNRDSETLMLTAGLEIEPTFVTALDFEAGYFQRSFDDAGLDNVDGLFIRSRGLWNPTPIMSFSGTLDRSVVSTLGDVSGTTVRTAGTLRLDWDPRENLILSAFGGYGEDEFESTNRTDTFGTFGVEADYLLNEYIFVSARAEHLMRDSTINGYDYSETRGFLEIGVRLCCQSDTDATLGLPRSYP